MNEYEAERQRNIEKNEALLREIGLTGLQPVKPVTPAKRPAPRKKAQKEEITPRRTSSRLSGIPADSETALRKDEKLRDALYEAEYAKKQRVEGPIELQNVIADGTAWDNALTTLKQVGHAATEPVHSANIAEAPPELKAVSKRLNALRLLDTWDPVQIRITPDRIFSIGMHPTTTKRLAFAGDKEGNLGIWDIDASESNANQDGIDANADDDDAEASAMPSIHHFRLHSRTISAFSFSPGGDKLYSSSYDGSLRCLDVSSGRAVESYVSEAGSLLTSVDLSSDGNVVTFATVDGDVGIQDVRSRSCQLHHLHEKKVGTVSFNPANPHMLVTASLDRTMKVWDSRKMAGPRNAKVPTLLAEYICSLSVSSAYFNSSESIVATSYDDTVKIFDLSTTQDRNGGIADQIQPDYSLKHNNQSGRWITVLKANWQKTPADGIQKSIVGDMNRKIDILGGKGEVFAQLDDQRITAVPAVVRMHDSQNWVIAGNASGKALFFS